MLSRRRVREPGPRPDWTQKGSPDEVRALLFRHLLLRLGVTRDGLALVSGVPRARVLALCGDVGPTTALWSEVPREQLDALERALRHVEPDFDLRAELRL